jgi:hypothetical protein
MRHRGGGNPGPNQGQGQSHNRRGFQNKNRVFDSNGPDVRIRGTAFQIVEKYAALAKDANAAGDRVLAESYLQHAEHYQRMITAWNEEFGYDDSQPSMESSSGESYEIPPPAGTSSQPDIGPEDYLGLPSSIIGAKPVAQQAIEEVA